MTALDHNSLVYGKFPKASIFFLSQFIVFWNRYMQLADIKIMNCLQQEQMVLLFP